MSRTLFKYVLGTYLRFVVAILGAILAIYLVADYVDRSKNYTGPNWVVDVLVLYAYKTLVVTRQLAPAALLLGAGAAVSALRRSGEVTAMRSLSLGPSALYLPVGVAATVLALGLVAFDEAWVVRAGKRVDEITAQRFGRWGDWGFYNTPKQWFRTPDWIIHLRGGSPEHGYQEVTLLHMTPQFRLQRRIDAARMVPAGGTRWRLETVVERTFDRKGATKAANADAVEVDLGVGADAFVIRQGRPEQMRLPELDEQISTRAAVGLPAGQYALAFHDRFAYPLAGLPAALLAIGLALRPSRRGNLTASLVEGLAIVMVMWGLMVVARTLVTSERMTPWIAGWLPFGVLAISAVAMWLRREGRIGWRGT